MAKRLPAFAVWLGAAAFFSVTTATSYARWANFEYRTFDLAYYVQAIWQLLRGRFEVSIEHVPLLGNHVEPIVFLFVPFFALIAHPITFVAIQNAALASMCPVGYRIARRLSFDRPQAAFLALTLLLAPATGYVALHEFHPEALAAPLLLLLIDARLRRSLRAHWLCFCLVLACKENMAFLLAAYCVVGSFVDRRLGVRHMCAFYLEPLLLAGTWFVLCAKVITPALNSGSIDYLALYERLGSTPGEILRYLITQPHRVMHALSNSVGHGNLLPGTLLPLLLLPLLRPRWLLIATPVLLQHLLSWRSSEWMIYFHYAAPLIPLSWIAAVEALAQMRSTKQFSSLAGALPLLLVGGCLVSQLIAGPADEVRQTAVNWSAHESERARKNSLLTKIPSDASVLAPLPYLSHLAMRQRCYSLHYILKGLKTLSRARYQPPATTDYVFVDFNDSATFDVTAGYYHPKMRTADADLVQSSDELLHQFLVRCPWSAEETNEYMLLSQTEQRSSPNVPIEETRIAMGAGISLRGIRRSPDVLAPGGSMTVVLDWEFGADRETFPWMEMLLTRDDPQQQPIIFTKGLCGVQSSTGFSQEVWQFTPPASLLPGSYRVGARFVDNPKRLWSAASGKSDRADATLCPVIPLGDVTILPQK